MEKQFVNGYFLSNNFIDYKERCVKIFKEYLENKERLKELSELEIEEIPIETQLDDFIFSFEGFYQKNLPLKFSEKVFVEKWINYFPEGGF